MNLPERPMRILIVEDESLLASRLAEFLTEKASRLASYVTVPPRFSSCLNGSRSSFSTSSASRLSGYEFLKKMQEQDRLGDLKTKVIMFAESNDPNAVRECARLGAIDYVAKPYRHSELLQRVLLHMQAKREVPDYGNDQGAQVHDHASSRYAMHLMDAALREALKPGLCIERLHMLTVHVAKIMKAVRVSIVRCELSQPQGSVIVSNDKREVGELFIDIDKYPEIFYVLSKDKLIAVDNLGKPIAASKSWQALRKRFASTR